MSNKERLFEMMGKINPNFKPKLNENVFNDAGEPNMSHSQARDYTEPAEPDYDDNSPDGVQDFNSIVKQLENVFDTILVKSDDYNEFLSSGHDIMLYDDKGRLELFIDTEKKYDKYFDDVNINDLIEIIRPYENTISKGMDAEKEINNYHSDVSASNYYDRQERTSLSGY